MGARRDQLITFILALHTELYTESILFSYHHSYWEVSALLASPTDPAATVIMTMLG